ncbi:MAG: hypothetical protein LBB88_05635 [Planctomycetaceae bacterium]|jgi:hypothetical protein|nr:hypothetical protein [Planctomycetaceae bacterium]
MKESFFSSKAFLNISLFFVLVIGGVWWSQSSIKSPRPDDHLGPGTDLRYPEEKATARAWQDPFEPYKSFVQKNFSSNESDSQINIKLNEIFVKDRDKNKDTKSSLLVVGVMIPHGSFGDRVERRQRLRVAVVSALAAGGYSPENSEELGFLALSLELSKQTITVPYEFFNKLNPKERRRSSFDSAFDRILVVWIADEFFAPGSNPKPIQHLSDLRNNLLKDNSVFENNSNPITKQISYFYSLFIAKKQTVLLGLSQSNKSNSHKPIKIADPYKNVPFYIFGPWSSTTLKMIYQEIKSSNTTKSGDIDSYDKNPTVELIRNSKMTFFNVFATASLDIIMAADDNKSQSKNELTYEKFKQMVGNFSAIFGTAYSNQIERNWLYPTCSDLLVAETVAQELKRRGINFDKDNIAMIAENDTLFGRSLPKIFRLIFERDSKIINDNFCRYTYLRGIDGSIQSNSNAASNAYNEANYSPKMPSFKQLSSSTNYSPKGNNQYDYLIRLRDMMLCKEQTSGKKFQAIGILGSDVYDKLLQLQILRPAFPNAIFFTTDLDAALWQSQFLPCTKNLIVGSSHGFQLNDKYQQGILPFRFSYQTALFQGILGATTLPQETNDIFDNLKPSRKIDDPLLAPSSPRLFEIGLNGPVDLSRKTNNQNEQIHPDSISYISSRKGITKSIISVLIIVILFLFILNWIKKPGQSLIQSVVKIYGKPGIVVFIMMGFVVSFICLAFNSLIKWYCQSGYFEYPEPFFWVSGLSAWPSIILWTITIFVSLILLIVALYKHRQSLEEVEVCYFSEHGKTQSILNKIQSVLYKTKSLLEKTQSEHNETQSKQNKELSNLTQVQTELGKVLSNLTQAQTELDKAQSKLNQTQSEQNKSQSEQKQNKAQSKQNKSQSEQSQTQSEQKKQSNLFFAFCQWFEDGCLEFLEMKLPTQTPDISEMWSNWKSERIFRAIIDIVALVIIFWAIRWLLTDDGINFHASYRDTISFYLGSIAQFFSYFVFLMLVWGTALFTRCCTNFIKKVEHNLDNDESGIKELKWSHDSCITKFEEKWKVDITDVADLVGIHFVAKFTTKACNLVLYPIVPLILLCVAQSSVFENHYFNNYYYFIFIVVLFMIFAPAYQLRHESAKIKYRLLERQRAKLSYSNDKNISSENADNVEKRKRIEMAIIDTENIKDGAFQSLLEHPFIQAILFLLGGISLPALLSLTS